MEMIKVESSNIKEIGFENDTLYVQYNSGLYMYESVPQVLFEGLKTSESKGQYMNKYIKNHYNYKKVIVD